MNGASPIVRFVRAGGPTLRLGLFWQGLILCFQRPPAVHAALELVGAGVLIALVALCTRMRRPRLSLDRAATAVARGLAFGPAALYASDDAPRGAWVPVALLALLLALPALLETYDVIGPMCAVWTLLLALDGDEGQLGSSARRFALHGVMLALCAVVLALLPTVSGRAGYALAERLIRPGMSLDAARSALAVTGADVTRPSGATLEARYLTTAEFCLTWGPRLELLFDDAQRLTETTESEWIDGC